MLRHSVKSYGVRLALFVGVLVLAACGSKEPPPPCPRASVVGDLATITKFRDGPGRDVTDVRFEGEIYDVLVQCKYDRRAVTVDLQVAVRGTRGPADTTRKTSFEYFVALADPQRNIVAKERFAVEFEFRDARTTLARVEELEPRIPVGSPQEAENYELLIGFQLTPEEIDWNERRKLR